MFSDLYVPFRIFLMHIEGNSFNCSAVGTWIHLTINPCIFSVSLLTAVPDNILLPVICGVGHKSQYLVAI
jgi:hypothetical protein